jgi:hypothetical protein
MIKKRLKAEILAYRSAPLQIQITLPVILALAVFGMYCALDYVLHHVTNL